MRRQSRLALPARSAVCARPSRAFFGLGLREQKGRLQGLAMRAEEQKKEDRCVGIPAAHRELAGFGCCSHLPPSAAPLAAPDLVRWWLCSATDTAQEPSTPSTPPSKEGATAGGVDDGTSDMTGDELAQKLQELKAQQASSPCMYPPPLPVRTAPCSPAHPSLAMPSPAQLRRTPSDSLIHRCHTCPRRQRPARSLDWWR